MLATSDNLTAEMLVKEIGVVGRRQGHAGRRAAGHRPTGSCSGVIPTEECRARRRVGPVAREPPHLRQPARACCSAAAATDVVGSGLATAGQDGSTLDGKFEQEGLTGVLQAKTGSLREVKALCGYMHVSGDDEVEFVLILNGPSATCVRRAVGRCWARRCSPPPPRPRPTSRRPRSPS